MLQKLFGFDPAQNKLKTEVAAGITTFLTMAYILAVNPNIFSHLAAQGMDTHAVFTATVLAAIVGTLVMAVYAKKPFGLAPGMGLNAFFVFTEIHGLVDVPPSVSPIFCQFDFSNVFSIDMVVIVFTFLFIDMFDTMGTLVGICTKAGMMKPDGRIHGLNKAFMADAVATVAGACFGTSTTTTYVALRVLPRAVVRVLLPSLLPCASLWPCSLHHCSCQFLLQQLLLCSSSWVCI